jgi:hypothetical protein
MVTYATSNHWLKPASAFAPWRLCVNLLFIAIWAGTVRTSLSQELQIGGSEHPASESTNAASDELSVEQARLADRFKRLEEVVGRLAELSASTDPRRARLLRDAIAQSREQDINVRFESIVRLLEEERLSAASTNQSELQQELDALLSLLLKADRDRELTSQRDRVRKYLKEIAKLIRMQKGIRARTEGGDELEILGKDQKHIATGTGELGDNIAKTECDTNSESAGDENAAGEQSKPGKPSESGGGDARKQSDGKSSKSPPGKGEPSDGQSPPSNPSRPSEPGQQQGQPGSPSGERQSGAQPSAPQEPVERAMQRLRAAQQQMQEALKKLDDAKREGAADRQREALKELEQAKAELERILRQLREEELDRTLTQLVVRFRRMLELQNAVYEGTVRLDRVPSDQRDHDDEITAARLGRQELLIVQEADKALLLLREEGSSVAFPEAVEQMRDDMKQVAERLAAVKVGEITQGLEQDIIAALEETIAALEKAIKDLEKNRTPPGQQPTAGQSDEPQLVDKLAELKMIRSLQMRIYQRTKRYGRMIDGEQAETAELLDALKALAERQQRVFQATADLEQGRND